MARLNQIVAVVEGGLKTRTMAAVDAIDSNLKKPQLFSGQTRVFFPRNEDGETFPTERQLVQKDAEGDLLAVTGHLTNLYDAVLTRDVANMSACADVVVDGTVVIEQAPVPFLLFLAKQLVDMRVRVCRLPVRDPSEVWSTPDGAVFAQTEPSENYKTKKTLRVLVKYEATDKHPAQTEPYTDDVVIGTWKLVKYSGAVSQVRKEQLLARVDALLDALRIAMEEANNFEVTQQKAAQRLFDWLLAQ